jgi:hypothetical protein
MSDHTLFTEASRGGLSINHRDTIIRHAAKQKLPAKCPLMTQCGHGAVHVSQFFVAATE